MINPFISKSIWLRVARFILLSTLFAIIYTQAPLYTSNQNLYFLPGLADAGYGNLGEDWLANSPDAMPVFSLLVSWTYRLTHREALFYVYYAILMGVYLFSALGIVGHVFPLEVQGTSEPPHAWARWFFLVAFCLVHSAAWRFLLSQTLGNNWIYLLEDGVADQRLLGTVFQPSAFGVLLVLSIYLFLKNHPYWAVICAALAASFHPTYLLSAAALIAAYVLLRLRDRSSQIKSDAVYRSSTASIRLRLFGEACLPGLVGLLAILPILIYTYLYFIRAPAEIAAQARDILVNYRIPHHALVSWWFDATAVIKIVLVSIALILVGKRRLFWILSIPFLFAIVLAIIQVLSGSTHLALLFPWRMSIFLVPLSTALILAWVVQLVINRLNKYGSLQRLQLSIKVAGVGIVLILVFIGSVRLRLDFQRQALYNDRPLFTYVAMHRSQSQLYLIPVKMQDFRLASGAPAFVDFKNHPYQAADVLEWYRRLQLATRFYKQESCEQLPEWIREEGIKYVVLPVGQVVCPGLVLVYQDKAYNLFEVP